MGTMLDLSSRSDGDGRLVHTVVCYCCKEVHEAAELGVESTPGYLSMPDYEEHVKALPDGRYLCEWCVRMCGVWECV
eukprot:59456-Chlamydomonas_euryale.AAC.1